MKLIPKDAVLAEIEKRIKINKECMLGLRNLDYYQGKVDALKATLSSIDTLEVKEVDLEQEVKDFCERFDDRKEAWYNMTPHDQKIMMSPTFANFAMQIAKHFFELGLKASNPLTWEDIKLIWNITDEMDNMPEEGFYKEVLKRFKAQKGE